MKIKSGLVCGQILFCFCDLRTANSGTEQNGFIPLMVKPQSPQSISCGACGQCSSPPIVVMYIPKPLHYYWREIHSWGMGGNWNTGNEPPNSNDSRKWWCQSQWTAGSTNFVRLEGSITKPKILLHLTDLFYDPTHLQKTARNCFSNSYSHTKTTSRKLHVNVQYRSFFPLWEGYIAMHRCVQFFSCCKFFPPSTSISHCRKVGFRYPGTSLYVSPWDHHWS